MPEQPRNNASRRMLSLLVLVVGALLLASVPLYMVFLSSSGDRTEHISGTAMIGSAVAGIALVIVGSALRD